MRLRSTPRGFRKGEFKDRNGEGCSIQESSEMGDGYLWLGIDDPNPKIFPGNNTGWHPYKLPENVHCSTRMHLDRKTAKKLIPLLQHFVKTGYLPAKGKK